MSMIKGVRLNNTTTPAVSRKSQQWYLIDAKNKTIGEIANLASILLQGKDSANFTANYLSSNKIIIINSSLLRISPNKLENKEYFRHSWYPGGIKSRTLKEQLDLDSRKVLEMAIKGMLPKNKLSRNKLINDLYIYTEEDHQHKAQQPVSVDSSKYFIKGDVN